MGSDLTGKIFSSASTTPPLSSPRTITSTTHVHSPSFHRHRRVVVVVIVLSSSSSIRWEVLVEVIQMPWQLKTMWHERLQGLVEDWIGGEELERTVTSTTTHARTSIEEAYDGREKKRTKRKLALGREIRHAKRRQTTETKPP
jgi:hypothetical protein